MSIGFKNILTELIFRPGLVWTVFAPDIIHLRPTRTPNANALKSIGSQVGLAKYWLQIDSPKH